MRSDMQGAEAELLLACAQLRARPETAERADALAARRIDWPLFLHLAETHGVMPLVSTCCCASATSRRPASGSRASAIE